MKNKLIVVAGPTAVGKTEYAINLAKELNGEIVSLDSVQVYKYLDIGSAKPSKEEMQGIPHYMISEVEPNINLNVKSFKDMATKYIDDIILREKTPILVGGTGFYIRAILYDTDFLYEDELESTKIRNELYDLLDKKGIDYLHDYLLSIDKESSEIIPKENVRRVIRAIEFYKIHGITISEHNRKEKEKDSKYDFRFIVLTMDREKLYERINRRVDIMIEKGLLKEVKSLINMGLDKSYNSINSIGYSELYDFCKKKPVINSIDELNSDERNELNNIVEIIKQHSRNYAKRQLTWFRAEKKIEWIEL